MEIFGATALPGLVGLGGALQGYALALVFWFRRSGDAVANRLLAALFFILTLYLTEMYLWISGFLARVPILDSVSLPFIWLIGPLYLAYTRRILDPSWRPDRRAWLHAIPGVVMLLLALPWLLVPFESRIRFYEAISQGRVVRLSPVTYLKTGLHLVQTLAYLVVTTRLLRTRAARVGQITSDNAVLAGMRSLRAVHLGFAALTALFVLLYAGFALRGGRQSIMIDFYWMIGVVAFLHGHAYLAIARPESFASSVRFVVADDGARDNGEGAKYARSVLTGESAADIRRRLDDLMERERPYLESNLSLRMLAARLRVSPHHLSQVVNQELGRTFHDYVNGLRVREARRLLADPDGTDRSVLDIAFESGFNTKSSFYDAFRRALGTTPATYRREAAARAPGDVPDGG